MKTRRILMGALALAMVAATVIGCKKENDTRYSCNPKISKWAEKNMESFKSASREQLSELPMSFQKASYLTLNPERRFVLWNEKLEIVKSKWDVPVQMMIEDLQQQMEVDWFSDEPLSEEVYAYLKEWENTMLSQHMDTIDYAISFMQLATEEELEEIILNSGNQDYSWIEDCSLLKEYESKAAPGGDYKPNCKCEWNVTCGIINAGSCVETSFCNSTSSGCGLLYMYSCKGYCENYIVELR